MSLATLIADAVGMRKRAASIDPDVDAGLPDVAGAPPDTRRLIRNRRYCRMLASQDEMRFDEVSIACAWKAVANEMALVPGGEVRLLSDTVVETSSGFEMAANQDELVSVESFYLDRDCVTNADYARFVQADGYCDPQHWPLEVLPNVLQFIDSTGYPAPKHWAKGNPPADRLDHPVVGICWYEANAYATWVGKRLPSTEEWQRAGTWARGHAGDGTELRYPWGNAFDPSRANTWAGGSRDTVPVTAINAGNTSNGVRQLIGNVWEWVDAQFYPYAQSGVSVMLDQTMGEVRGGAFDSYFHSQATCQFRTGHPLLYRGPNVGFRCCVSVSSLPVPPDHSPPDSQTPASERINA